MTRDEVISKIRKLRQLTLANGCTEAEALLAAAKISELMAAHGATLSEADIRAEGAKMSQDTYSSVGSRRDGAEWSLTGGAVAKLFGCRCWREQSTDDSLGLGIPITTVQVHFFGLKLDVEACLNLTEIIACAIAGEAQAFFNTLQGRTSTKINSTLSFRVGMADRLSARLHAMIAPTPATGQALMVLKNQLVSQEFSKLGLNFGRSIRPNARDASAYASGQAAGSRVDLGGGKLPTSQRALPSR